MVASHHRIIKTLPILVKVGFQVIILLRHPQIHPYQHAIQIHIFIRSPCTERIRAFQTIFPVLSVPNTGVPSGSACRKVMRSVPARLSIWATGWYSSSHSTAGAPAPKGSVGAFDGFA